MKEFIFTWSIENISYSWHRKGKTTSFSFTANTMYKTIWVLIFYPRGCLFSDWLSLYLYRSKDDGPRDFLFDCELSCVSANNLVVTLQSYPQISASDARDRKIGCSRFLKWHEVFVRKKDLYLSQDTLTFRCRMWTREGDDHDFGQSFGRTRLEIERILTVKSINPRIALKETFSLRSKRQNKTMISVSTFEDENALFIDMTPISVKHVKFYTCKLFIQGRKKKRIPCEHITSWWGEPCREIWRLHLPNTALDAKNRASVRNKPKLIIELIYATGERTKSVEKINPCSFKFPEFASNSILSCIPSRKLSDCPSICKDLWNLYTKQILCDVELITQTTSFWVHKTVLCARSPVFLAMFINNMKETMTNCVEIVDLNDNTLEKLLKFLYTDIFEETQWDAVLELYYFADKYQVVQLKKMCCSYFMDKIKVFQVCELLMVADRHSDSYLKSKIEDYIMTCHEGIFGSPMWKQFSEKHPQLAVKCMLCKYAEARENGNPDKIYELSSCHSVMDDFRSLYQSQMLSDIVVKTGSSKYLAHKAVLCAGSSSLRKVFASGKSTNSVKMEDLEDDTVSRLLLFLYTDSLGDAKWEEATKLYHAAVAYQIERLKVKCSCYLLENLKASNAADLLLLAHMHRDVRLESLLKDFASLCDKEIIGCQGWAKGPDVQVRQSKRLRLM